MVRGQSHHPEIPQFDGGLLKAIAAAIAHRAKALKYHVSSFACSRDASSDGEILHLDVDTLEVRATRLRLMVWEDGNLWLGVHQSNARRTGGWAFALQRSGNLRQVDAEDVVKMIERTLSAVHGMSKSAETTDEVEKIWAAASLQHGNF